MTDPQTDDKIGKEAGKAAFEKLQGHLNNRPKVKGDYLKKLACRIDQGVDAKETKLFAHQGKVRDKVNLIDFRTRGFYTKLAIDIFGASAPKEHRVEGKGGGPVLVIHERDPE